MEKKKPKSTLGKVWRFIWDDDSIWSWIVNVILAFVLIKFIVYPGLGLLFSTTHPIVAVVSGSMEHDGSFDTWWKSRAICSIKNPCNQGEYYDEYNITKEEFKDFRFPNGFNTGDIMVLYGTKMEKVKVGDTIVFRSSRPDPIIHRVIEKKIKNNEIYFRTKGDHNTASIDGSGLGEEEIGKDRYIGRAAVRVPYLGWIKLGFVKLIELFKTAIGR